MSGLPTIFVDFQDRDLEGRFYEASLSAFDSTPPLLGSQFLGTDHEQFTNVACAVLAIDYASGVVYHRPVHAADVPGTWLEIALSVDDDDRSDALNAADISEPDLIPAA